MGSLKKRSFSLCGHRTSVALEAEFWAVLDKEAADTGQSLARLIQAIDDTRGSRALASALRVHALAVVRTGL
jgi:predicted DNA-binding ribbon-helix-helix protein